MTIPNEGWPPMSAQAARSAALHASLAGEPVPLRIFETVGAELAPVASLPSAPRVNVDQWAGAVAADHVSAPREQQYGEQYGERAPRAARDRPGSPYVILLPVVCEDDGAALGLAQMIADALGALRTEVREQDTRICRGGDLESAQRVFCDARHPTSGAHCTDLFGHVENGSGHVSSDPRKPMWWDTPGWSA